MNIRRVAIVIMLIFLNQQVDSVWAAATHSMEHSSHLPASISQHDDMAMHCDSAEHSSNPSDTHGEPMSSEDCCQVSCECCVGHCQSSLAPLSLSLELHSSCSSQFEHFSQSPRATSRSHFRPPIFA